MFTDDHMSEVRAMKEAAFNSVTTDALVSLYTLGMAVWEKYLRVGNSYCLSSVASISLKVVFSTVLKDTISLHKYRVTAGTLLPSKAVSLVFGSP